MTASARKEKPIRGFIKVPHDRSDSWLPLLRELYQFESVKIAGPASERRRIDEVIWSIEDVCEATPIVAENIEQFGNLLAYLEEERQLMKFPAHEGNPDRYITRVGELVRIVGHTYEYWWRGRPAVTAVRWQIEDKMIPRRSIPAMDFRDIVVRKLEQWVPSGHGLNLRNAAKMVCEAVAKSIAKD